MNANKSIFVYLRSNMCRPRGFKNILYRNGFDDTNDKWDLRPSQS